MKEFFKELFKNTDGTVDKTAVVLVFGGIGAVLFVIFGPSG